MQEHRHSFFTMPAPVDPSSGPRSIQPFLHEPKPELKLEPVRGGPFVHTYGSRHDWLAYTAARTAPPLVLTSTLSLPPPSLLYYLSHILTYIFLQIC
jgi:hypothetical protein